MPTTNDPADPRLTRGVNEQPVDQAAAYLVLSDSDRAAEHGAVDGDLQPVPPGCASCTAVVGQPGAWDCDPNRPGCPLHETPELTR